MAFMDYYLCDICGSKTFYDGDVNYDTGNGVGDMKVVCPVCNKTHKIIITPRIEEK